MPAISIVIPLYNKAEYIERALKNVLLQTFNAFEIIVVNDGSTDGGELKVESFADPRIRLINQANAGVSAARNKGVAEANCEYIAFLDADDEWKSGFLEEVWRLASDFPQARIYATSFEVIRGNDRSIRRFNLPDRGLLYLPAYIDCCIELASPICGSAVMVSKSCLEKIGGFPEGQNRGEDLDTWFRLLRESPAAYCNLPFAIYWCNLPNSLCAHKGAFHDERLLKEIENEVAVIDKNSEMRGLLTDYLAWTKSLVIERLTLCGRGSVARSLIASIWASKRLRKKLIKEYIKSYIPCSMLSRWVNTKTNIKRLIG